MAEYPARFPVHIYWEDTDAGGIVYHSNYLKYMERARSDMMRVLNLSQAEELARPDGRIFVAADISIRYRRAAKLDDDLTVVTRIKLLRRASIIFEQNVYRGEELLTEGTVRVACVSRATMSPCEMPSAMHERMRAFLDENDPTRSLTSAA